MRDTYKAVEVSAPGSLRVVERPVSKDLLTRALDAHGGLSRWREIEAFRLRRDQGKLITGETVLIAGGLR
jgi:hypothetical protein